MDCMIPICKYVYLLCSKQSTFNILLVAKVCLVLYYARINRQYSQHQSTGKRGVARRSPRDDNGLNIDAWAPCWEVCSNQHRAGEECNQWKQGYMSITHLFITPQELNAVPAAPDYFYPSPSIPSALGSLSSSFPSHPNETESRTWCFHLLPVIFFPKLSFQAAKTKRGAYWM